MKHKIFLTLMALMMAFSASAQDEQKNSYAFVGLQGGVMYPYNGLHVDRSWSPAAALSFGYYFNRVFGLRLQGNGTMWDAKLADGTKYESKAVGIDLDALFNLTNIFFPHRDNLVNLVAVLGAPFNLALPHTWVQNYAQATTEGTPMWNTAWKVGGQLEFNVAKRWAVNLEAGTNYVRQRTDGIYDNNKWWPYAMAGLTFKLGKCSKKVAPEPVPVVEEVVEEPVVEETPAPVVVEEKKPEPVIVKQPAKTTESIYFRIGRASIEKEQASKVDQLAKWAADHPEATFELTGYADKGTGTERINMAISEKRAAAVKDALVKKGVSANRINASWKGDTVQPYANNDDNRVVIVLGEEK